MASVNHRNTKLRKLMSITIGLSLKVKRISFLSDTVIFLIPLAGKEQIVTSSNITLTIVSICYMNISLHFYYFASNIFQYAKIFSTYK